MFNEMNRPPRQLAEPYYDIHRWTVVDRGGHFPALENPTALVRGLREVLPGPLRRRQGHPMAELCFNTFNRSAWFGVDPDLPAQLAAAAQAGFRWWGPDVFSLDAWIASGPSRARSWQSNCRTPTTWPVGS